MTSKCVNGKTHARDLETLVRHYYGLLGMHDNGKVFLSIEFYGGFEYFNTRPYHNYETWGHGWRIKIISDKECKDCNVVVENECILCGIEKAIDEVKK